MIETVEEASPEPNLAEVDSCEFPWLNSLAVTLLDLEDATNFCKALLVLRDNGKTPVVQLSVATDDEGERAWLMPWSVQLGLLPAELQRALFWDPLIKSVRDRIAKLVLDIGGLAPFVATS